MLDVKNPQEIKETKPFKSNNYFSLANIVESILNNESDKNSSPDNSKIRQEFISITSKFNQGNANSAYEEYLEFINKIDDDIQLLNLAKIFYQIGFFSLAHNAEDKIIYKNQYFNNIN
ncbi:hypothetical protein IJ531_07280, partial [bacterium]|nr:hypothetical protein [bacterium]